jgi:hypothetical protein
VFRDDDQPAHRPAGQPHQDVGRRGRLRSDEGREQAEHRGRPDRRCGEQVRRQRDEADLAAERRDQRRGRQAGRRTDRDGVGGQGRDAAPAQRPGPGRGDQHDRPGRRHREGEPEVGGQRGLQQQEAEHAGAQGGHGGPLPPRGEGHEGHQAHGRRPENARARAGEHDEPQQRQAAHECLHAPVDRPPAQRPQHPGDHECDVGPGNGHQVRQAGATEVLGEHRVHRAGVPDDETGQQPTRAGAEDPGRLVRQTLPHGLGRGLHPAGRAGRRRRPPRGEDRDESRVPRRHRSDPDPDRLPRRHIGPVGGRGEQEDRVVHPGHRPVVAHGGHGCGGHGARRTGTAHRTREIVEDELDLHRPLPLGQGVQR